MCAHVFFGKKCNSAQLHFFNPNSNLFTRYMNSSYIIVEESFENCSHFVLIISHNGCNFHKILLRWCTMNSFLAWQCKVAILKLNSPHVNAKYKPQPNYITWNQKKLTIFHHVKLSSKISNSISFDLLLLFRSLIKYLPNFLTCIYI